MRLVRIFVLAITLHVICGSCNIKKRPTDIIKSHIDWPVYGGNKASTHYSKLTQIDTNNVSRLTKVWEYRTHDAEEESQIEANPIVIDGILYGVSPRLKVFAISAITGEKYWTFDPLEQGKANPDEFTNATYNTCRGVAVYVAPNGDKKAFYVIFAISF